MMPVFRGFEKGLPSTFASILRALKLALSYSVESQNNSILSSIKIAHQTLEEIYRKELQLFSDYNHGYQLSLHCGFYLLSQMSQFERGLFRPCSDVKHSHLCLPFGLRSLIARCKWWCGSSSNKSRQTFG